MKFKWSIIKLNWYNNCKLKNSNKFMNFKSVKKGDTVDIISPGTACTNAEVTKIKNIVNKLGLIPIIFREKDLTLKKPTSHGLPSFGAWERFCQLENAITNPDSNIIWCSRGGYGSADLLPYLRSLKKPKTAKIFIGFSDISSLNTFLIQEWGWQVISAPMLIQLACDDVSSASKKAILDLIFGKTKKLTYKLKSLNSSSKKIEANIVGGCISVLAGNFGTKNQVDWQNKILFLEDEGEAGERLERYFNQIITIAVERKKIPAAILLGNFLTANAYGTPKAKNIQIAIEKLIEKIAENNLKIPVFEEKSKSLGHSKNMMPLILGKDSIINDGFLIQKI